MTFKAFNISNRKIGIGQMTVINIDDALKNKDKYLSVIEKISKEQDYDIFMFCITDVIKNNTYILYNNSCQKVLDTVFENVKVEQGFCLKGVVSRKKQIIPLLMDELN